MQTYTLFELNNYIRQVVALNFEAAVWITCEISQVRASRGQVYLELIQQNDKETDIIASNSAVIWYKTVLFIKKKLGELYDAILQDGTQVSLKVKVDFHERYGLKLNILDIDPSYTIGQLEMQRRKILERLKKAGVIDLNKQKTVKTVLQNIAIISSEQAAGYKDFVHQLEHNTYGYQFKRTLHQTAVQGIKVEREISDALDHIQVNAHLYDCIVIIRGGGSKLDLAGFDNYNIGYKIATSPLPVFTGIGHEIDSSVADIVAHTPLKTPTAVADFLIEHNMVFESDLNQISMWIQQHTKSITNSYVHELGYALDQILSQSGHLTDQKRQSLQHIMENLELISKQQIIKIDQDLEHKNQLVNVASPASVLKRGYAIVRQEGKVVSRKKDYAKNKAVEVEWQDGRRELD